MMSREYLAECIAIAKSAGRYPATITIPISPDVTEACRRLPGKVNDRPVCGADKGTLYLEAIRTTRAFDGFLMRSVEAEVGLVLTDRSWNVNSSTRYEEANFAELLGLDQTFADLVEVAKECGMPMSYFLDGPPIWVGAPTTFYEQLPPAEPKPEPPAKTWRELPPLL